ncbi:MAG: CBS domain-containing protein [Candidatus Hodarchaeales archaeon]|jgi:CBS domain-containing protein
MTRDLITISGDKSVIYASEMMIEKNIGSILVYEDSTVFGIITERDIVRKVITDCRDLCEVQAKEIATRDLITIAPEDTIEHALITMYRKKIKRIPVKDSDSHELVGIITTHDIISAFNTLELG